MVLDGIPHVVSMDYSETVIDNMKAIHRNIQGLTCIQRFCLSPLTSEQMM